MIERIQCDMYEVFNIEIMKQPQQTRISRIKSKTKLRRPRLVLDLSTNVIWNNERYHGKWTQKQKQ